MTPRTALTLRLRITDGRAGTVVERSFDRFPIRLGRSALNDLVLPQTFVSQFHAVIEKSDRTVLIRDLGSANGIRIAGAAVAPHDKHDLAPHYAFEIGPMRFQGSLTTSERTAVDEATAMLIAVAEDPSTHHATEAFQAFVDAPAPSTRACADVALQGLRHLAATFAPHLGPLDEPEQVLELLRKMKHALDLLFGAVVPLRQATRQLRTTNRAPREGEVEGPATASELAALALDWRSRSNEALRGIQGVLADAVIRQLSLLASVRRVLDEVSPRTVESVRLQEGRSLDFGPFRDAARWRVFARRHASLDDDARVLTVLFGGEDES